MIETEKKNINVPVERRESNPVELIASGFEGLSISLHVRLSMVNESGSPLPWHEVAHKNNDLPRSHGGGFSISCENIKYKNATLPEFNS